MKNDLRYYYVVDKSEKNSYGMNIFFDITLYSYFAGF